ncbi:MAG: hypothetical protein E7517_00790 [Ruminococcaceae bacterium]|nr:hypothetical protein [Oscillospiraceae bacterium]
MTLCLPYTQADAQLYRCLLHDLKLEHILAPVAGKYTRQAGKTLAENMLCEGLQDLLGSLYECYFLGADTAVVALPCAHCERARVKELLEDSLQRSAVPMRLFVPAAKEKENREFFAFLHRESRVSLFLFLEAKRHFYECRQLLESFGRAREKALLKKEYKGYIDKVQAQVDKAGSLLELKITLAAFEKKANRLFAPAENGVKSPILRRKATY